MSLQFVLGSSGSGKTEYVYSQIVAQAGEHPKKNYLVIVPEQFTMQTQQKLVELAPNHAIMNIDVLSFKRLAYRVFDEMGRTDIQVLEETGKNLVLRKLASEQEENLTVLRPNMNRMGYIGEVKSLISEFMQYNITWEQLEKITQKNGISPVLSAKLRDISVMYRAFETFMKGSYITDEEILSVLASMAKDSEILRDSVLVFDEFTGFTPVQNQLMQELLQVADRILITLTMDAREDFYHSMGSEELFDMSKKTIHVLSKMADGLHIPVLEPIVLADSDKKRFCDAPALAFLEKNLFRTPYEKMDKEVEEIHLAAVHTPKDELTLVAREINRLVRQGYRYREIAVVTGSVETYQSYIDPLFAKYEIPYFMDTTKEVLFHPFIEFIRATLEIITGNYSYEAMMRFLRCGFCAVAQEDLDACDNYLVATGIRGHGAWNKRWLRMPRQKSMYDLEKLNEIREMIADVLEPVYEVFSREDACVSDGVLALYQLLVRLDVEKQLWQREQELLEADEQTKSKEYGQIFEIVMHLLEKYNLLLGQEPLDAESFTEVLDAGLSAASVAVIPPGYDSVTIGDIERTRLNHVKILFFVGVNDGLIPKSSNHGGIISEYEREMLLESDIELAPGAREQAFIQRFYLYRNLTKPSRQLYMSYAKIDREGKALRPSYLVAVIRRIFPKLELKEYEEIEAAADFYTKEAAADYLIHGKKDETWFALAKWFMDTDEAENEKITGLLTAAYCCYKNTPISQAVARALYGRRLEGSVTRLERFAACAYAHYLQYGLQLRERETAGFESVDMGNLYHEALERYSRKLEASEYDWFGVPDETRSLMAAEAMDEALEGYPNASLSDSAQNMHQTKRMKDIFDQTVWALTKQVRAGAFVPTDFEIRFSELEQSAALEYELANDVQMRLTGRIDRLDTYEDEQKLCVKVIDYKSGNTKFDLIKIYQGLQLQLVVYMNAAMELADKRHPKKEILPGGILYYHIDDPVLETEENISESEAEHALLMELRPDGLVNADETIYRGMDADFEGKSEVIPVELKKSGEISMARSHVATTDEFSLIQRYVTAEIKRQGQQIYAGDVSVNPYQNGTECSCNYCPYASVCGIDGKIPGYGYRHMENLSKDDVFDRMETDLARQE